MVSTTANVLATIGTVCWCIQMIPQIIHNYKKKDTTGLSEVMVFLWCLCAPFFAVYFVAEEASIPIQIQPHLFGFFCWIVYIQVMYYPPVQRSKKQIMLRGFGFLFFQVVVELGFIIPLKKIYKENGTEWPLIIFGVIASILLALGLIPPYVELAKRQGRVVGINFIFLLTDLAGAVFSLASLAVDPEDLDIMGLVLYCICATLEVGIMLSQVIWFMRFKWFRKSSDDLEAQQEEKKLEPLESSSSSNLDPEMTKVGEVDEKKLSAEITNDSTLPSA